MSNRIKADRLISRIKKELEMYNSEFDFLDYFLVNLSTEDHITYSLPIRVYSDLKDAGYLNGIKNEIFLDNMVYFEGE